MRKKLGEWRRARPGLFLVAACYVCGVALLLLAHLGGFAANRVLYATGKLAPAELTMEDFDLAGIATNGEACWSVDADPQMLLKDQARRVENLVVVFEYRNGPRIRTAFWAKPGQDYSIRRMVYSQGGQGQVYYLPATGGQSLRLDPASVPGAVFEVKRIAINQPRPLWAFFAPGAGEWMLLLVLPGLAASGISIVKQAGLRPKKQGGGQKGDERKAGGAA